LTSIKQAIKFLLAATIVAVFLAFSIANREIVTVSFSPLPYSAAMPEFLLAIICIALGSVAGGFAISIRLYKAERQLKAERRRIMALENEIQALHVQQQEKLGAPIAGDR